MTGPRAFVLLTTCVLGALIASCDGRSAVQGQVALERGIAYLRGRQSDDGAFRSEQYGAFKEGSALTPGAAKALLLAPMDDASHDAVRRAAAWLRGRLDPVTAPADVLDYPVYSSALSVIVLNRLAMDPNDADRDASAASRDLWLSLLKRYRHGAANGWSPDNLAYGGWGYSVLPPRMQRTPAPFESDISSTVFAVGALRLAGTRPDDPAIETALVFVERCQNFAGDPDRADPAFDDGGFFFSPTRPAQNKAGPAGRDRRGRQRFHSYGTATADGLRALLRCGLPPDHPRVAAARRWLEQRFSATSVPGTYEPDREPDRDAKYYYWCWSVSHTFRMLDVRTTDWTGPLIDAMVERQQTDGSWRNHLSFQREDDPLVATPFAIATIVNCVEQKRRRE